MKNFFCKVWCALESLGYARAASILSREHKYDEARQLMLESRKCSC